MLIFCLPKDEHFQLYSPAASDIALQLYSPAASDIAHRAVEGQQANIIQLCGTAAKYNDTARHHIPAAIGGNITFWQTKALFQLYLPAATAAASLAPAGANITLHK